MRKMFKVQFKNMRFLPEVIQKGSVYTVYFYTNHLWNQLTGHISERSVKDFKNKLVENWREISCLSGDFKTGSV